MLSCRPSLFGNHKGRRGSTIEKSGGANEPRGLTIEKSGGVNARGSRIEKSGGPTRTWALERSYSSDQVKIYILYLSEPIWVENILASKELGNHI